MYSALSFDINGTIVTFSAFELISIAQKVLSDYLAEPTSESIAFPQHEAVDKALDHSFREYTRGVASALENIYHMPHDSILNFLNYAYRVTTDAPSLILTIVADPKNQAVLNTIKTRTKTLCYESKLDQLIILPMQLIRMKSTKQWLLIAKYLSEHYLAHESLSGWWFQVGGRVIRVRNDVSNGALRADNKQFYASDHGFEKTILNRTSQEIYRCLRNFTWSSGGTYFRAFKFWLYFTLADLRRLKIKFIERLDEDIIKSDSECEQVFLNLRNTLPAPAPLPVFNLSADKRKLYESVYEHAFMNLVHRTGTISITTDASEWIKTKFFMTLTDEILASEQKCDELFDTCLYNYFSYNVLVRYKDLSEQAVKARAKKFEQIFKAKVELHQQCLKEEFLARINDEIAISPQQCQLLLISLAHDMPQRRGTTDESKWGSNDTWNMGSRERLEKPEVSNQHLSAEARARYEAIFNDLIEQFHYVNEAMIDKQVEFMSRAFGPFHTQIRNIMHPQMAEDYILVQALVELAKEVNHGKHEPLFREVNAYGDREAGDSYHKFEPAVSAYLRQTGALSEAELAAKMRDVLEGKEVADESLGFLPCLAAAWFISESARNPLTTLTSLMLLDMLEQKVIFLTSDGKDNWYCWRNVLIHPLKGSNVGRTQDLYGRKVNLDEFGGCHPMVQQGSVAQAADFMSANTPLSITRQKEGHIIAHWLQQRICSFTQELNNKYQLRKVAALKLAELPKMQDDLNELQAKIAQKDKQLKKDEVTIRAKRKNAPDVDVSKYETNIKKLQSDIQTYEQQLIVLQAQAAIKKKIQAEIIEPLLKLRLSCLRNLFKSQAVAPCPPSSQTVITPSNNTAPSMSPLLSGGYLPVSVVEESIALAREKNVIGPRAIPGWTLQDVERKGNCFYLAIVDQLNLMGHEFLQQVPSTTAPNDSLRLLVQGANFRDREDADQNEIETVISKLNIILAIADTRHPANGYVYYFINKRGQSYLTNKIDELPRRPIVKLAFTGNHYLSVRTDTVSSNRFIAVSDASVMSNIGIHGVHSRTPEPSPPPRDDKSLENEVAHIDKP